MEILNKVWTIIAPYLTATTITGIISTVIFGCLKGGFNKAISKINVDKMANDATDKGLEKIKTVSFEHSIQPIVESRLKVVQETANKIMTDELKKTQDKYNNIILILEKFSAYFNNSVGVPDTVRQELKQALNNARIEPLTVKSEVVEQIAEKKTNKPTIER